MHLTLPPQINSDALLPFLNLLSLHRDEPSLAICEELVIDFTRVRIANSSFINALIGGLFEQHGEDALQKLSFKGCLPTIQVLIESAISFGLSKHSPQVGDVPQVVKTVVAG